MRYSDVIALAVNYDEIAGVMPTGEGPYLSFFDAGGGCLNSMAHVLCALSMRQSEHFSSFVFK
jgi:hypothetical protein